MLRKLLRKELRNSKDFPQALSGRLFFHLETNAPDRLDVVAASGFAQFFAEVADVDTQGTFHAVGGVFTEPFKEQGLGDDL